MSDTESGTVQQETVTSVERTIADTGAGPGETTSVTVTAEFSESVDPAIIETVDPPVSNVAFQETVPDTDLKAVRGDEELVVVYEGVTSISLTYNVTLPDDAQDGDVFTVSGVLEVADGETTVPGDTSIEVGQDDGIPALPGQEDPPQDLDNDGLYEDVSGDGAFTIADVQVFFQHRDATVVQNHPEAFNFAGDEPADVSIGDVQALFQLFQERS
jgi:PKD repeat protein